MRQHGAVIGKIADWLCTSRWQIGGVRYFHLELSSRHRAYAGPVRLVLLVISVGLWLGVLGSATHTVLAFHALHEIESRLDQIREQDRQLVADAQGEGIDLGEIALRQLPAEVVLANQLLAKRNFSWTLLLSGLEGAIPPSVLVKGMRLDPATVVIHMTGAAVRVEDVTAFTLKLQSHPIFHDPVLGQHRTGDDGLVEFDLTLKYRQQGA